MSTNHQLQHDDILQNRMGLRIAARLSAGANEVSHDVSERLRVARQQALTRRKRPQALARNTDLAFPVISAACRSNGPIIAKNDKAAPQG